jgi:hypothetical protein
MLSEAILLRLAPLLQGAGATAAYFVAPLPPGVNSGAQGGLGVLLPARMTTTGHLRSADHLRRQVREVLPPDHGEVIILNDSRPSVAAAVVERGAAVYSGDEAERLRYEMMILSRMLEFTSTVRRFLAEERNRHGRQPA